MFGTSAARFNDDGVTALYQHLLGLLAEQGLPVGSGVLPRVDVRASTGLTSVVPAARVALSRRDRRRRPRLPPDHRGAGRRRSRRRQALRTTAGAARRRPGRRPRAGNCSRRRRDGELLPDVRGAAGASGRARVEDYSGDELVYTRAGQGDPHPADPARRCRARRCAGSPCPRTRRRGGAAALPAPGEPARLLPVHRRGVPVQARRRGAGADVRRRGRRVPDQPAVPAAVGRR